MWRKKIPDYSFGTVSPLVLTMKVLFKATQLSGPIGLPLALGTSWPPALVPSTSAPMGPFSSPSCPIAHVPFTLHCAKETGVISRRSHPLPSFVPQVSQCLSCFKGGSPSAFKGSPTPFPEFLVIALRISSCLLLAASPGPANVFKCLLH